MLNFISPRVTFIERNYNSKYSIFRDKDLMVPQSIRHEGRRVTLIYNSPVFNLNFPVPLVLGQSKILSFERGLYHSFRLKLIYRILSYPTTIVCCSGIFTNQSSPPSLTFICRAIFVATLCRPFSFVRSGAVTT